MKPSRRDFIHAACAIAVSSASHFPPAVEAAPVRGDASAFNGGRSQTNLVGFSRGTEPILLNILKSADAWSYNSPPADATLPTIPVDLDVNGYPLSFPPQTGDAGVQCLFGIEATSTYNGVYVLDWQGNGTVGIYPMNFSGRYGVRNLTSTTGSGRCEFKSNGTSLIAFYLKATAAIPNNIHNVRFYKKTMESRINAGEAWEPIFVDKMREADPGCLRSLGFFGSPSNGTNDSNIGLWEHRKTRGYYSWATSEIRGAAYAGKTTNNGNDYSVTFSGYALTDKALAHVQFNATAIISSSNSTSITSNGAAPATVAFPSAHGLAVGNAVFITNQSTLPAAPFSAGNYYYIASIPTSTTMTLSATRGGLGIATARSVTGVSVGAIPHIDINGTGFKPIAGFWLYPGWGLYGYYPPTANKVGTLVYDATTGMQSLTGGDTLGNSGILNGVPPEDFVQLCELVGAHPWVVEPYLSTENASTPHLPASFMPGMMQYIKDNAPAWMKPVFEPPNETWDIFPFGFVANNYALAVAWHRWGSVNQGVGQAYGKWVANLGAAAASVWGGDRSKYSVACSIWTIRAQHSGSSISLEDGRLMSSLYVSNNAGPPAYTLADRVCMATYWTPEMYMQNDMLKKAFDWTVTYGPESPAQQLATADAFILTAGNTYPDTRYTLQYVNSCMTNLKAWAQGTGVGGSTVPASGNTVSGMVIYEGGFGATYLEGPWQTDIVSASVATSCVLTLASTSDYGLGTVTPSSGMAGNPAAAGMGVIPSDVTGMTQLNVGLDAGPLTFAAGSPSITSTAGPHRFSVGDTVCLALYNRLTLPSYNFMPPEIPIGKAVYVVAVTIRTFQLSLTRGGTAIVFATTDTRQNCYAQRCLKVTAVSGNNVTIDFNSTGLTAGSSGKVIYAGSQQLTNNLLYGAKQCGQMGVMNDQMNANYNALNGTGWTQEFVSNFIYFGTGSCWNVLDSFRSPANPHWMSIIKYNH